jgi:cytochrome b6-f complex iron-sulfur subunit
MPVLAVSSGVIAAIVVVFVVDLFAIMFGLSFVRERKARRAAEAGAEVGVGPKTPKPVSRRDFFRRSLLLSFGVFAAQFGGATIAFLWPNLKGGFGSVINAGKVEDIKASIADQGQPYYYGAGRFYIVPYAGTAEGDVDYAAEGVTANGLMPLYQRCVHLGCRVPFCAQSKWFECPCHGSKYNLAGEYKLGPAPRGLDRFSIQITDAGDVMVDTSAIVLGPPRGTDTIDEPPQGPFCVAPG